LSDASTCAPWRDLGEHGVSIAGSGTAGWGFGTADEADGIFFRSRITAAALSPT